MVEDYTITVVFMVSLNQYDNRGIGYDRSMQIFNLKLSTFSDFSVSSVKGIVNGS